MSLLATTPGKRLVMPSSATAASALGVPAGRSGAAAVMATTPRPGPERSPGGWFWWVWPGPCRCPGRPPEPGTDTARDDATAPPGPCRPARGSISRSHGSRGGRDLDLARDDLLLVGVELRLDVVDLATGGGVVHAAGLEVVDLVAGDVLALRARLQEVVDGDVDLLDHRGEDDVAHVRRGRQGLVGVDTDRELDGGLGGREDAGAGATSGVVDDVGAALVETLGRSLALGRVVEAREVRRLREVLALDRDLGVGRLGARDVAGLELLDEVGRHATDVADR